MLKPPSDIKANPESAVVDHVVMTLPQFVRLCADVTRNLKQMEEKGLITRRAAAEEST